jgi:hypothetical protein
MHLAFLEGSFMCLCFILRNIFPLRVKMFLKKCMVGFCLDTLV